jgi:ubiquinone/menaquinone biosynthesis C-methylase UbiE
MSETQTTKTAIQQQFAANAAAYTTSAVHARGASLQRLLDLTQPQPDWQLLDVATGTGHTALTFAPFVAHVTATDITPEMLAEGQRLAAERSQANVTFQIADAESLPYEDGRFHLVTCRIAPHHFTDVAAFIHESARVLRPGGFLAIVDNIVPGSRLRGKKATRQRAAGEYINTFEKLRDPSHGRCLSLDEWINMISEAELRLKHQETLWKEIPFEQWAARHTPEMRIRLKAMLLQAPLAAAEFFAPKQTGDALTFRLREGLLIALKPPAGLP